MGYQPLTFPDFGDGQGVLTNVLNVFTALLNSGGTKIIAAEMAFAMALLSLQWTKLILTIGVTRQLVVHAVFAFIGALIWFHVAKNASSIVDGYMRYMGGLGSTVGGTDMSGEVMTNPSLIISLALKSIWNLMKNVIKLKWTAMPTIFYSSFMAILLLVGFVWLGCQAVMAVIRAKINALVGIAMLPFAIEPRTAFLAGRGIGLIIDSGISLGVTSIIIGTAYGFLAKLEIKEGFLNAIAQATYLLIGTVVAIILTGGLNAMLKGGAMALKVKAGKL